MRTEGRETKAQGRRRRDHEPRSEVGREGVNELGQEDVRSKGG